MTDRKYKGQMIRECDYARGEHNGRWIIQTYHGPTGNPWSDENCPHYHTLAEARASINESIRWEE